MTLMPTALVSFIYNAAHSFGLSIKELDSKGVRITFTDNKIVATYGHIEFSQVLRPKED